MFSLSADHAARIWRSEHQKFDLPTRNEAGCGVLETMSKKHGSTTPESELSRSRVRKKIESFDRREPGSTVEHKRACHRRPRSRAAVLPFCADIGLPGGGE